MNKLENDLSKAFKKTATEPRTQYKRQVIKTTSNVYVKKYSVRRERKRLGKFMFLQVQKKVCGSIILQGTFVAFFLAVVNRFYSEAEYLLSRHLTEMLGALAVLLVLFSMPFLGRARRYHMYEVEAATFVSTVRLTLIHLGIILVDNIIFIGGALLLTRNTLADGTYLNIFHILLPYLVACSGCIIIQRNSNHETAAVNYTIFGITLLALILGTGNINPKIYSVDYSLVWISFSIIAFVIFVFQIYQISYRDIRQN